MPHRIGGLALTLILRDLVRFAGIPPYSLAVGLWRAACWSPDFGVDPVEPARYAVALSVVDPDRLDHFEGETGPLSRGVVAGNDFPGCLGTGFTDYPASTGPGSKVQWQIARDTADDAAIHARDTGKPSTRHRELAVNGNAVPTVAFERTVPRSSWQTRWRDISVVIPAPAGRMWHGTQHRAAGGFPESCPLSGLGGPRDSAIAADEVEDPGLRRLQPRANPPADPTPLRGVPSRE